MNPNADNNPNPEMPEDPNPSTEPLELGMSDASIQQELAAYKLALEQEFARAPEDRAAENAEKYTTEFFKRALPQAAAQIVWLAGNSDSDSVRLRASQIIMDKALSDAVSDGDPIKDLLSQLSKSKPSTKKQSAPSPTLTD